MLERLLQDSFDIAAQTWRGVFDLTGNVLRRANLGVGGIRLTPEGMERLRRLAVDQLKVFLEIPDPHHVGDERVDPGAVMQQLLVPEEEVDAEQLVRRRFALLLERSLSPNGDRDQPALLSIVTQLSPDEARILRLMDAAPEQPVVDLVAGPRVGFGGRTVLESLSMIGERAGCIDPERTPIYLANLARLGVIGFHDEELDDHADYELVEVGGPFTTAAERIRKENLRPRSERRSVRLTPLGRELCDVCLRG